MPHDEFIIWVYCVIDDLLRGLPGMERLRQRGFSPALSDAEVITMEVVGEYLGQDTDKAVWRYFRSHWHDWFPKLGARSTFAKHCANLWRVKQLVQERLAHRLGAFQEGVHLIDGFPMPACHFRRAHFSRCFQGEATYGFCASKNETYYGFHGHLLISGLGTITAIAVTPANVDEREALWDFAAKAPGLWIGDKGYLSTQLRQNLMESCGVKLETPLRDNMSDPRPPHLVRALVSARRLVETVIGQLTEQFHVQKVRARDLWHLTNRVARKVLAHTVGVYLNSLLGRAPLQFEGLIQA